MRIGSLFSGAGLGDLGWEWAGHEIAFQIEIDDYCQQILNLRWPHVPKWRDIQTVDPGELPACDLIAGGPPCQPFSTAWYKRRQALDERNLWPEMLRIIQYIKPNWVLFENVPGISRYCEATVRPQLESEGYQTGRVDTYDGFVGGETFGLRLWIVAASNCQRRVGNKKQNENNKFSSSIETIEEKENVWPYGMGGMALRCESESRSVGNDHGSPYRMDRLKAIGNGQTVPVVRWFGEQLMRAIAERRAIEEECLR